MLQQQGPAALRERENLIEGIIDRRFERSRSEQRTDRLQRVEEPAGADGSVKPALEELPDSLSVVVAAHDVYFDRARKLWYCDVEIDPGDTYFPWTGAIPLPPDALEGLDYRLLVTEVETYLRDGGIPGDPAWSTSPLDFVRERIVYADTFEL